jgi:putative PIN family toxin of toxin-antitoxin system
MRVVVDTNVFISAIFKATSVPAVALSLIHRDDTLLRSADTEAELRAVLARPRFAPYLTASATDWLNHTLSHAELVSVEQRINLCRDAKDNKFLELAHAGRADLIVSGDADLLELNPFRNIPIINPAAFISARR